MYCSQPCSTGSRRRAKRSPSRVPAGLLLAVRGTPDGKQKAGHKTESISIYKVQAQLYKHKTSFCFFHKTHRISVLFLLEYNTSISEHTCIELIESSVTLTCKQEKMTNNNSRNNQWWKVHNYQNFVSNSSILLIVQIVCYYLFVYMLGT